MSVYFFEVSPKQQQYLSKRLPEETLRFSAVPLRTEAQARQIGEDAEIVSPFVHSVLGAGVFEALPVLKMIATRSTGFDHINVACADSRGIPVCNVPTYGENTVAEHTFALILALSRNIHKAYVRTTSGDFTTHGLEGFDLKGKTIGVVGTGHIGMHVIRIANGFGMHVIAYDVNPNANAAEVMGFSYKPLHDLLAQSDIITLHAPLNPATNHMFDAAALALCKLGAILVNTARGGLVDTQALLNALDEGRLAGAGLDVVEGEEVFSEEKQLLGNPDAPQESLRTALRNLSLLKRQDLVITPHIAYDSREAIERIFDTTVDNIRAFRAGSPINVVHD